MAQTDCGIPGQENVLKSLEMHRLLTHARCHCEISRVGDATDWISCKILDALHSIETRSSKISTRPINRAEPILTESQLTEVEDFGTIQWSVIRFWADVGRISLWLYYIKH